jgi:hypothetical protein
VGFGVERYRQPEVIPSRDKRDGLGRRSGNPWLEREYPNGGSEEISKVGMIRFK